MKSTENFKKVIESHLNEVAAKDEVFADKMKAEGKSINDCVTYILNTVKKSGCNGFTDAEIFGMAIHYYDEKDIKVGPKVNGSVVVNHKVELTEKEIQEAKEKAKQKVISEETERLRKKPSKPAKDKKKPKDDVVPTLFD